MTTTTAFRRALSIATGAVILAASATAVISHTGQTGAHATLTWTLAGGLFVGAIVVGSAWGEKRYALAIALMLALASGEIGNIGLSIESIVIRREADGKATRDAAAAHKHAAGELVKAEHAVAAANNASTAKSAEKGCKENCRKLLEAQVEIAMQDLARARALYGSNPPPSQSATALADRVGVPAWLLDVGLAVLLAIGANGLAATLVAYGAHATTAHSFPNPDTIPADELEDAKKALVPPRNRRHSQHKAQRPQRTNAIEAYVTTEVALGRAIPSQQSVAARFGVAKSTVCEIMQDMERRGLITRRREGRRTVSVKA